MRGTLLDLDGDLGPTSFHGITGRDVAGSPTIDSIAGAVRWHLAGHVPVGHNVRFLLAFLTNEFRLLNLEFSPVQGLLSDHFDSDEAAYARGECQAGVGGRQTPGSDDVSSSGPHLSR